MKNNPDLPDDPDPDNIDPRQLQIEDQRQKAWLTAIFETNTSGVAVLVGPELRFAYANPVYRSLTPDPGIDPLGRLYEQVWHNKSRFGHRDRFRQVLASGEPYQAEDIEFHFPAGERRIFNLQAWRLEWNQQPACLVMFWDFTERKLAEECLAFKADLLENMHDAVIATDGEMNITAWNPAAEQLYGWTEIEALGKNASQLLRSELSGEEREQVLEEARRTGLFEGEVIHHTKDGRRLVMDVLNRVRKDASGEVIGYISANRDITGRKRVEQELRDSEQRHALLFDRSAVPTFLLKFPEFVIADANAAFEKLVGYPRQEMLGKTIIELGITTPEVRAQSITLYEQQGALVDYETSILTRLGEECIVIINTNQLELSGQPFAISTLQDITERKRAEAALARLNEQLEERVAQRTEALGASEARYHLLVDMSPYAILIQADGRYAFANPAGLRLFGAERAEQLLGRPVLELIHPDYRETIAARIRTLNERQVSLPPVEGKFLRLDGTSIEVESVAAPIEFESKAGAIVVVRDISAIKANQEALNASLEHQRATQARMEVQRSLLDQREQERMEIARDLHDGPTQELILVTFAVEDLLREERNPQVSQKLEAIQSRLKEQINELRDYAGELRPFALSQFGLGNAIQTYASKFAEKHAQLHVAFEGPLEGDLLSEEKRLALYRIYQESLTNILKHARASEVKVRLATNPGQVLLEIEDNGVGFEVPKDWLELARHAHLGLVGMRERAEAVHGQLEIYSHPGQGTLIRVNVPLGEG